MYISDLVNEYARPYTPYMGDLVNHLPMGQLALFQMNKDLKDIKAYSEYYVNKFDINAVKKDYPKVNSIEDCLGKRDLYESCLQVVKGVIEKEGLDKVIRKVLNSYPYGLSSGIFHTSIRLFYAVEGLKEDKGLEEEVARALAYYVTGYKKAKKFDNRIKASDFKNMMKDLLNDSDLKNIMDSKPSLGQKMKALYHDKTYLKKGFVLAGSEEDKIRALLEVTLPLHDYYQDIIVLHCTTGLHALIGLKDYFDDFSEILDIMTTCIATHLLTLESLEIKEKSDQSSEKNWDEIIDMGSNSKDVHTIKYTYTCSELYKLYKLPALKMSAICKISND